MAKLSGLSQLQAAGGFVSREPLRREVVWTHPDPETGEEVSDSFDIFIPRNSLASVLMRESRPEGMNAVAWEFSQSLMLADDDGKPVLISYDAAEMLDPSLATAIMKVIQDARAPKKSTPQTNSSVTSSPAALVETP
jgi:hypothetical protein